MIAIWKLFLFALPMCAFWSRRKKENGFAPSPEWASFFTPERYALFQREIHRHFQRNEIACQIKDGIVYAFRGQDPEPCYSWGLLNLAQVCNQSPVERWPEQIQRHFDVAARSEQENEDLKARMDDFSAIRDHLGVRLGPIDLPRDVTIWREEIPGVLSYIVIDLPSSMVTVNGDALSRWGVSSKQLFEIALDNLRKQGCPDRRDFELDNKLTIVTAFGDSFFTASHALLLDEYPELVGPHGSLVSIPHRHALLCYPIRDLNVVGVVHRLWAITQGMEKDGPGSITAQIYWYFQGQFTPIPCEIKDNSIAVRPPDVFVDMLEGLGEVQKSQPE